MLSAQERLKNLKADGWESRHAEMLSQLEKTQLFLERREGTSTSFSESNQEKVGTTTQLTELGKRIRSLNVPEPITTHNFRVGPARAIVSQAPLKIALISATLGLIAGYLIWGLTT